MLETTARNPQARCEKRSSPRYPCRMPVRVSSEDLVLEGTAEIDGVASDASLGGLFVRSDLLEPVGTWVRVRLLVEDQQPIILRGAVAWVAQEGPKGPGMGIELSRIDGGYHQWLIAMASRMHP